MPQKIVHRTHYFYKFVTARDTYLRPSVLAPHLFEDHLHSLVELCVRLILEVGVRIQFSLHVRLDPL